MPTGAPARCPTGWCCFIWVWRRRPRGLFALLARAPVPDPDHVPPGAEHAHGHQRLRRSLRRAGRLERTRPDAGRRDLRRGDALGLEPPAHARGAPRRESLGVPLAGARLPDAHHRLDLRPELLRVHREPRQLSAGRLRLAPLEHDIVRSPVTVERMVHPRVARPRRVGAAVFVVDPLEHLGRARAAVARVEDPVVVVVEIGAAVVVVEAVAVLGDLGAAIPRVVHPVTVAIRAREARWHLRRPRSRGRGGRERRRRGRGARAGRQREPKKQGSVRVAHPTILAALGCRSRPVATAAGASPSPGSSPGCRRRRAR